MPIDFPDNPSNNAVYTVGNRSWVYASATGTWTLQSSALVVADTLAPGAVNGQALLANSSAANGLQWGQAGSPADDLSALLGSQIF